MNDNRGEVPGGDDQHQALRRRVAASKADHQPSDSSPQDDQRSLRAEHQPKADCRQAPRGPLPARCPGPEGPPVDRPLAGICPPSPGRRVIATATISAPTARIGSDHHFGGPL